MNILVVHDLYGSTAPSYSTKMNNHFKECEFCVGVNWGLEKELKFLVMFKHHFV